jgi:hypothetical protein
VKALVLLLLLAGTNAIGQNRFDVVIDEIMADPTPQVGLPNNEWIEIKNATGSAINLLNWRLADASGQSGPFPNITLQPDSFLIICSSSAVTAMNAFGRTISVTSFPSLDNASDLIFIKSSAGKIIHAVNYSDEWYQSVVKEDGGWTLEMIDTHNPCCGSSNWKASVSGNGGTPGKKNSVDGINGDIIPPHIKKAYSTDSLTIVVVFDEPIDSLQGATTNNYSIDGGLQIISALCLQPVFKEVQLKLNAAMVPNTIYTVSGGNIKDCSGNTILSGSKVKTGLPSDPLPAEFVINEILFNPRPAGYDYVEFYNNSNKILDASQLMMANRNSSGVVSSLRSLSDDPFYIFPKEYFVVTENAASLAIQYLVRDLETVSEIPSLPSFPDDEGFVIALNKWGIIVDEVDYKDDWHFKLIDNNEGISLERLLASGASQDQGNWHSAASTAGFGTPGYKNSQQQFPESGNAMLVISPKIFSPDNDGHDDVAIVHYSMEAKGFIANITIFDAGGRPVRFLVKNALLGYDGYWNWDGLDEKGVQLPIGSYIIFTELFNLEGKKAYFKNSVVLARKL